MIEQSLSDTQKRAEYSVCVLPNCNLHELCYSEKDVKEKIQEFLKEIKTICPNTLFNKEVDNLAKLKFGDKLI